LKKHGNTIVPRNKDMNEYLVALGQKIHKNKREQKMKYDKQKKREDYYDSEDY
jgi:hypothetical protein